jgi:Cft2 family RNA processing exonuclease
MIDCGADWLKGVVNLRPNAIFLTHAHSDHASGLKTAHRAKFSQPVRLGTNYSVLQSEIDPLSHRSKQSK